MLDFYPTLLELAGAPVPPYVPGTPMISAAREVLVNSSRFVYIDLDKQSADLSEWDAAIIKGRHKVASNNERSEYLIFDRETDPNERTNLVGTDELPEDLQRTLIAELESQVAHYEQMGREFGEPEWMEAGEGLKDELEALGYL